MIVCTCHLVSDRDIHRAAREGCSSFDALQADLRVATACGRCRDCAHSTFAQACTGLPLAAGMVAGVVAGVVAGSGSVSAQRSWHVLAAA